MSAQLILYPQSYNGTYTFTSALNQYVAAGNFITGISSNTATSNSQPSNDAVTTSAPISAWRSFNSTGGTFASCSVPSVSTSGLTLASNGSTTSSTGVYQLIPNLTVGQCYQLKIRISSGSATGTLYLGNTWNVNWTSGGNNYSNLGGVGMLGQFWNTATGVVAAHFILAQNTTEVLLLDYRNDDGSSIVIRDISLTECPFTVTQTYNDLTDGQVICDLYEDESIPLNLSIDDFKNVAEKTQSYSKDFHLPNTKRNSKIFGHIFEVTRSTDAFSFNPYIKTRAILKEDSYTLFEGFLKLIDINDKESEISYNVNLFSESVTLKDILENKSFADIDFTELQHDYTITNIKNSWDDGVGLVLDQNLAAGSVAYDSSIGSGNTNVLKYPFVNWRGDWSINPISTPPNNIGLIDLEQVFRPWIQIRYLIKRIINEAGFEFVSDFFDTANFKKLFMDFNWGQGLGSSEVTDSFSVKNDYDFPLAATHPIIWAGTSWTELELGEPYTENPTGIASTYVSGNRITAINTNTSTQINYSFRLYNHYSATSSQIVHVKWEHFNGSGASLGPIHQSTQIIGTSIFNAQRFHWSGGFNVPMNTGDYLIPYFKSSSTYRVFQGNEYQHSFPSMYNFLASGSSVHAQITSIQTAASSLLHAIRGEINQWEFLKGIFTMFNLVVVSEDEVLRIEPYGDIFVRPIHALNTTAAPVNPVQHNWTDKVDISDIKLKPLELKRMVKFAYEDDEEDYSLNVYKKATSGYLYGTLDYDGSTATSSQISNLTGENETIATPFAPTLIRPATDLFDVALTIPQIYSGNEDGTEFEDFENKPRILYNLGVKQLSTNTYYVPAQNGVAAINAEDEFLQFGHLTEIPTTSSTIDYNFGACQLIQPIGAPPIDNLFQVYWSPYYDELYHPDIRVMTLKVNLTPADIQNFKFYDTVVIKNREYRVNKIEYKPNTLAKVEFILIP